MRPLKLAGRVPGMLRRGCRDDLEAPTVRLDSNRFMKDAHRLYESRGFVERPPYEGSEIPAELQRLWRFYELRTG